MSKSARTRQALESKREADATKKIAKEYAEIGDSLGADMYDLDADELDQLAIELSIPVASPTVSAGEVVPEESGTAKNSFLRSTLKSPDSAAVDASAARTDLLLQDNLDIAALGVDAAHSIDADNSLEKMLVHQMAAAHRVSMELMGKASGLLNQPSYEPLEIESRHILASKLFNSAIRMMNSYQQGLLALNKLRNGGKQTVTVQHVSVGSGGQAVIGNVSSKGGSK
jgi:hypothetical protein